MVREAYANWNSLKEIDHENMNGTGLLTQGLEMVDQCPNHHQQAMITAFEQNLYLPNNNAHIECGDNWQLHSPYNFGALQVQHAMSESSSDGVI